MNRIISWFAENHVAANLLMLFIIVGGVVTALTSKVEIFPETTLDLIEVSVEYPGASPSEVEEAVVKKIEDQVAGLAGVKEVTSMAREGMGSVTIEVMKGWDQKKLLDDVKSAINRITTFPKEAERPVVSEVTRQHRVISIAVYGDVDLHTLKTISQILRDDITSLPGITLATIFGARKNEIHIEVPEENLRRYSLTLLEIAEAIKNSSLDLPAGRIKSDDREILVRTKGRRYYAADYADVVLLALPNGKKITLGRIAELRDGFEDVDLRARFQGKPAVIILVYRVANQSALKVAEKVKRYIDRIRPYLPQGVYVQTYDDRSQSLKSRLRLLIKNMSFGLILVCILLGLFLDIRLALWVSLGIPVSFLVGLMALPQFDVSINMISLFAFIMVLGIVVDDAIVIGENVFRKRHHISDPLKASIQGTMEVGRPVIFSVLTTVVAFWPLLLGTGVMGKFMRNIPVVVILVLLGSLLESLLILPSHLARSHLNSAYEKEKGEKAISRALNWLIKGPYTKALIFCLRWRYITISAGIAMLLLGVGLWTGGIIKFTFFPKVESDVLQCSLTMPVGTPLSKTVEVVDRIETAAREAIKEAEKGRPEDVPPLLKHTASVIGLQLGGHGSGGRTKYGGNLAQVFVQLLPSEQRDISAHELTRLWRKHVGIVPNVDSIAFQAELFSVGNPIEVHLSLYDHERLVQAAEYLKKELRRYPGVSDISDSFLPGKDELQIKLKPKGRDLGLTLADVGRQVRGALYGSESLRLERDQDEVKVMVRYPETERKTIDSVERMRIHTKDGFEVPFGEVAFTKITKGYATIERTQRRRIIKVTADVDEKQVNAHEIREYLQNNFLPQLRARFPGLRYSIEGEGKREQESLADVVKGFAIALFGIYALLAIPLRSFTQPFIIMLAIPFSLMGAVLGHIIMGMNLSLLSLFGMVGLAGVAVNDSLVLVDMINRLRGQGNDIFTAMTQGGAIRFRAIILTSLTTFAGLVPLILEKSLQAQFLIPMAVSLGFGVLFATSITLILVPCGYAALNDLHEVKRAIINFLKS